MPEDVNKQQRNYKEERALFFARNRGRTLTRIWFMYAAVVFFSFTAILRTFFVRPFRWWDLSGFLFVAAAVLASLVMRRLLKEGERLLAERGESVKRPSLKALRRRS